MFLDCARKARTATSQFQLPSARIWGNSGSCCGAIGTWLGYQDFSIKPYLLAGRGSRETFLQIDVHVSQLMQFAYTQTGSMSSMLQHGCRKTSSTCFKNFEAHSSYFFS